MLKKLLAPLLLICLSAPAVAIDIGAMPACAGYDADLGGCPTYTKATACTVLAADGVISNNAGQLISVYATGLTANDDILIYDNASAASGTVILNGLNLPAGFTPFANFPAPFANGAYADVTLTTGNINVCYSD